MIDPSQSIYYLTYALLCIIIGIIYLKIKSTEGVTITTNEFKLFQSGFLTGYSLMILGELMSTACFFHTFIYLNLSVEQITKLYVITIASTTLFGVILEIIDIGNRKNKCILSAILYTISMASIFFGGHFDMLLMGRIMFGVASAIHHSAFDSYVIYEHTSQGFPDDWLSQTFTGLTHAMVLVAALSGVLGQTAGVSYSLGTVALSCAVFALGGIYIFFVWSKDSYNGSKFMLSQFLQSVSQTVQAARANRQSALLIGITSLCESAITIFTYYWAPWMVSLTSESGRTLPFEIIFASFVVASLLGTYLTQLFVSSPGTQGGVPAETAFQGLLVTAAAAFFLGSVFQTPVMSYLVSLVVQLCIGGYWPSVGALRGRMVMPELRASTITICRLITLSISAAVLTLIHFNSLLTLTACASLFGAAAYLQTQLNQSSLPSYTEDPDYDDGDA